MGVEKSGRGVVGGKMNTFLFLKVTTTHKFWVFWYLLKFSLQLIWRGIVHDSSKLSFEERLGFIKIIDKLETTTYGSKEYREGLKQIEPSVDKHKKRNSHHPEYYKEGIEGMNMLDLIEMVCDWKAAVKRGKDGNIDRSFEVARTRFNMKRELEKILRSI